MKSRIPTMKRALLPVLFAAGLAGGCIHVKTDPVEVNAHVTIDVNVKVDRALDDFFGDLDKKSQTIVSEPASKP